MKNKKGFTLVELLVVIVILGLLIAIAIPSGLAISKKIKQKMLDTKIEQIESAAIVWGQNNKTELLSKTELLCPSVFNDPKVDKCITKTITELLELNALEEDEIKNGTKGLINPITNEPLNDCKIEIYQKNKRIYAKYDINGTNCYYEKIETEEVEETEEYIILINDSSENQLLDIYLEDLTKYAAKTSNQSIKSISKDIYDNIISEINAGSYTASACPKEFINGGISDEECFLKNNTITLNTLEETYIKDLAYDEFTLETQTIKEDDYLNIIVNIKLNIRNKTANQIRYKYKIKDEIAPYLAYIDDNNYMIFTGNNLSIESKELYDAKIYIIDNYDNSIPNSEIFSYTEDSENKTQTKYCDGTTISDSKNNKREYEILNFYYIPDSDKPNGGTNTCNSCNNCYYNQITHGGTMLKSAILNGNNYTCDGCNIGNVSIMNHTCKENNKSLICDKFSYGECSCKINVELVADCENGQTYELEIENYAYNY